MLEINVFDRLFFGAPSCVAGKTPSKAHLVYGQRDWPGISLFADSCMMDEQAVRAANSRYSLGWLVEARGLWPGVYEESRAARSWLDGILTYDAELLREPGYLKYVKGGIWIPQEDWGLPRKTRFCSFLYGVKDAMPGHRLRHEAARMLRDAGGLGVDVYYEIGRTAEAKLRALRDYAYTIVIEADRQENLFSENLLDAVMLGCVPLYWGCPNIGEYLGAGGLVAWETLGDLERLLRNLGMDSYYGFLPALAETQRRAARYEVTENLIAEEILIPFLREKGEMV